MQINQWQNQEHTMAYHPNARANNMPMMLPCQPYHLSISEKNKQI